MVQMLTKERLRRENLAFVGTAGVSAEGAGRCLRPAFRDPLTGRVEIARHEDGRPAPVHIICGLPAEWVCERDAEGRVTALRADIESGFVRDGVFYTREQAARLT
jgi:hypothetical protein